MHKRILYVGFWFVAVLTALEILVFFALTFFRPPDRIFGYRVSIPQIIPTFSDFFKTKTLSDLAITNEQDKAFYPQKLEGFQKSLNMLMDRDSSFVKEVVGSYIVAGKVVGGKTLWDEKNTRKILGYEIELVNSKGQVHTEKIMLSDVEELETAIREEKDKSYTERRGLIEEVRSGDYIIIRKSSDLLTPENLIKVEIEVIRVR